MKYLQNKYSPNEIYSFLQKVDSYFEPAPLSTRVDLREYSEKIAKKAEHFSCEVNNQLVGILCCYINNTNGQTVYITLTCIDPKYFGLGIAKKLTENCELYANKIGFKYIEMEIPIKNFRSVKIHLKMNYEIIKKENDSYFLKKII